MSMVSWNSFGPCTYSGTKRKGIAVEKSDQRVPKLPKNTSPPASFFHGGDGSGGDRDAMLVDAEGSKQAQAQAQALALAREYVERAHDLSGTVLRIREFSSHLLNANLLLPGTFSFAKWLVQNRPILDGQRILELGSGTGALAIFLRKALGVDITTSDYDDREIEENIAYNCRINNLAVLPHIRHMWGDPFPIFRPDWDIVIASDILLYVEQYPYLIKTISFLLREYKQKGQRAGCTTITNKSGTQVPFKPPALLISWCLRSNPSVFFNGCEKSDQSVFFEGCEKAGLEVQHLGHLVYLVNKKN